METSLDGQAILTWTAPISYYIISLALVYLMTRDRRVFTPVAYRQKELVSAAGQLGDGYLVVDPTLHILEVDGEIERWHGDIRGLSYPDALCARRQSGARCDDCPVVAALTTERPLTQRSVRYTDRAGDSYKALVNARPLATSDGHIRAVAVSIRNRSEREAFVERWQSSGREVDVLINQQLAAMRHEFQTKTDHLNAFAEISLALASEKPEDVIQRIVDTATHLLRCQVAVVRRADFDETNQRWGLVRYASLWNLDTPESTGEFVDLNTSALVVDVYRSGRSRRISQLSKTARALCHIDPLREGLQTAAYFPLTTAGEVIGTFSLYRNRPDAFSEQEMKLGQTLTNQLAGIINGYTSRSMTARTNRLREEWVAEIERLARQSDPTSTVEQLASVVADFTQRQLSAEVASVFILKKGVLTREAIAGLDDDWFIDERYLPGQGITGQVMRIPDGARFGQPQMDNQVDLNPDTVADHLHRYQRDLPSGQVKHLIAVPLNGHGETIGILRIVNHINQHGTLQPQGFSRLDLELMVTIASLVAFELEQAIREEQQEQRIFELDFGLEVGEAMVSSPSPKSALERSLTKAKDELGAEAGWILLSPRNEDSWRFRVASGLSPLNPLGRTLPIGAELADDAEKGRFVLANDSETCPRYCEQIGDFTGIQVRNLLVVPIEAEEKVIGLIALVNAVNGRFDGKAVDLLRHLAIWVSRASARLVTATDEQRRDQLNESLLEKSLAALAESLDLDDVLRNVLRHVRTFIDHDTASLFLLDGELLRLKAHEGFATEKAAELNNVTISAAQNRPFQRMVESRAPLIIPDNFEERLLTPVSGTDKIRAWLGAPIIIDEVVVGHLALDSVNPDAFTNEDASCLMDFARQVAVLIKNGRVLDELRQKARELDTLHGLGEWERLEPNDLQMMLDQIVADIRVRVGCDSATIVPYDSQREELRVDRRATAGERLGYEHSPTPSEQGLSHIALAAPDEVLAISDLHERVDVVSRYANDHGFRAVACIAFRFRDQTVGVLFANYYDPHYFTPEETSMIRLIAAQAAVAIYKTNLLEETERAATARERNRLKDDLHNALVKFRFSPLKFAEDWRDDLYEAGETAYVEQMDELVRRTRYTYRELDRILQDMHNGILVEKGLVAAIKNLIAENQALSPVKIHFRKTNVSSKNSRLPAPVEHGLFRITQESIGNSLAHGELDIRGGEIAVTLAYEGGAVRLSICDNGCGFDVNSPDKTQRLGLKGMRHWADDIGAELFIGSVPEHGTRIAVYVPEEVCQ